MGRQPVDHQRRNPAPVGERSVHGLRTAEEAEAPTTPEALGLLTKEKQAPEELGPVEKRKLKSWVSRKPYLYRQSRQ